MKLLFFLFITIIAFPSWSSRWDADSNPSKITRLTNRALVLKFDSLPLEAKLKNIHYVWSDTYWPSQLGGIAYRWNAEPNPQPFKYRLLTRDEVRRASLTQLEKLSPAEKYDIYMGNYDYPMTKKVLSMYSPRDLWWEGICHGWAAAAVVHAEPARVNVRSRDGVLVPFGSSDVKGLLSFYYAKGHTNYLYTQIGRRCDVKGKVPGEDFPEDEVRTMPPRDLAEKSNCADVNAGAFHLVLTNMIGIQDKGFVAEVDRFNDIWNQPVGEYDTRIVSRRNPTFNESQNGAVKVVHVKTDMTYGEELNLLDPGSRNNSGGFMSMNPVTGTDEQTFSTRHYEYTLELNARGEIIGGEWISITRPDFLWLKSVASQFGNANGFDFYGLNEIYKPVR